MNVWLASYPRSGNTFFRIILSDRYGLASNDGPAIPPERWGSLKRIDATLCPNSDPNAPHFTKTHLLPGSDTDPAVYIVRNGLDALVSYTHFALTFGRQQANPDIVPQVRETVDPYEFQETLRGLMLETQSPFGTWSQNVNAWAARPKTAVIRYEDLVRDPLGTADRALKSIGLSLEPVGEKIPTFDELKAVDPQFFRRGTVGSHRQEFPAELLDLFWTENGETMRRMGYMRNALAA